MYLEGDSAEYEFLTEAAESLTSDTPGATCEIGLRRGGGTEAIILGTLKSGIKRPHIAIDPYGNIDYPEGDRVVKHDYTNQMRNESLANVYRFCAENRVDFIFMNLEDKEFFRRFSDGVPFYDDFKSYITKYALVHFDGPHSVGDLIQEVTFFAPRTPYGGFFIFDDVNMYKHELIDQLVKTYGFSTYKTGTRKIVYIKDKYKV